MTPQEKRAEWRLVLPPFVFATSDDYYVAHADGKIQQPASPTPCVNRQKHLLMLEWNMTLMGEVCIFCNPQWCTDRSCVILEWMQEERWLAYLLLLLEQQRPDYYRFIIQTQRQKEMNRQRLLALGGTKKG